MIDWAVLGPLLGTLIGGGISLLATRWSLRHQANEQRKQREADLRRDRLARVERMYVVMHSRACESKHLPGTPTDNEHHWSAFMLLAPPEVKAAFDRCRDLWWEWQPGDEYDDGSDEMKRAADDLAASMRAHLAELEREVSGAERSVRSSLPSTPKRAGLLGEGK